MGSGFSRISAKERALFRERLAQQMCIRDRVRIPLKAVVTDTNRAWTFAALLEELHAEHRAVQKNDK